jgi:alpha-D-xyloside xylohydrolase
MRKYLFMRERLRPYTRRLMQEAHEKGAPLMRTMFYEFPQDSPCWELKDQYMYGPDILVAPVMQEGVRERSVYLPEGETWINPYTGQEIAGGQNITVEAPLDVIPVFVRKGFDIGILKGE